MADYNEIKRAYDESRKQSLKKNKELKRLSEELDELESGFIILNIDGNLIGIIIDRVSRVVSVDIADVQDPPKMMGGIGSEYIKGVVRNNDDGFLIVLDIVKLFDPKEMQKILIDNKR